MKSADTQLVGLTKQDILNNPKLINQWCKTTAEIERLDSHKMSKRAKEEFGDVWSDAKINRLISNQFKNESQQHNAQQKKKLPPKQRFLKKYGKALVHAGKKGWINLTDDFAQDLANAENYMNT